MFWITSGSDVSCTPLRDFKVAQIRRGSKCCACSDGYCTRITCIMSHTATAVPKTLFI